MLVERAEPEDHGVFAVPELEVLQNELAVRLVAEVRLGAVLVRGDPDAVPRPGVRVPDGVY